MCSDFVCLSHLFIDYIYYYRINLSHNIAFTVSNINQYIYSNILIDHVYLESILNGFTNKDSNQCWLMHICTTCLSLSLDYLYLFIIIPSYNALPLVNKYQFLLLSMHVFIRQLVSNILLILHNRPLIWNYIHKRHQ